MLTPSTLSPGAGVPVRGIFSCRAFRLAMSPIGRIGPSLVRARNPISKFGHLQPFFNMRFFRLHPRVVALTCLTCSGLQPQIYSRHAVRTTVSLQPAYLAPLWPPCPTCAKATSRCPPLVHVAGQTHVCGRFHHDSRVRDRGWRLRHSDRTDYLISSSSVFSSCQEGAWGNDHRGPKLHYPLTQIANVARPKLINRPVKRIPHQAAAKSWAIQSALGRRQKQILSGGRRTHRAHRAQRGERPARPRTRVLARCAELRMMYYTTKSQFGQ